ncbi:hypothetical protein [Streptomyces sp. BRA346]|uniref:hypothetical protein n=1 Tax=Streptomyces sp. BRA346 TaxID=2878199 RepID=UPI004062DB08
MAGSLLIGRLVDRVVRAAGTGRVAALVGVIMAVITGAEAVLPVLAPVPLLAGAALVLWGAAGWALQVPQQHRLPACKEERGTGALALNNPALYLGSAVGSALGGAALSAGLPGGVLPWAAAGVAALGVARHLRAVRGGSARGARTRCTSRA